MEKAPSFLKTVAMVGLAISAAVFVGIVGALLGKYHSWQDFRKVPGNVKEPFWVRTWITCVGFIPDLALPIVFAVAWMAL